MPVPIHKLNETPPYERCCFCRSATDFWTLLLNRKPGEQVAICQHCANRANPEEVPSKSVWIRRERIAGHPTFSEVSKGNGR